MADNGFQILLAILGSSVLGSLITYFFTRRKVAAETKNEEVDTDAKVSDFLKDVQGQNVDLYKRNAELEKAVTDRERTIETFVTRLEVRDKQLEASNKQLDLLRKLAEQAPITETLRAQLDSMNQIIIKLQDAQTETTKILSDKEKSMQELLETNRDLTLKKPPKA
jgi:hypothetical protein